MTSSRKPFHAGSDMGSLAATAFLANSGVMPGQLASAPGVNRPPAPVTRHEQALQAQFDMLFKSL